MEDLTLKTREEIAGYNHLLKTTHMIRDRFCIFDDPGDEVNRFFKAGIRLEKILKEKDNVLEAGCGYGDTLMSLFKRFNITPYGVDLQRFVREPNQVIQFKEGDIQSLPFADNFFDFAFSYMALMYLPDKLKGISEIYRVLKIGGIAHLDIQGDADDIHSDCAPDLKSILKTHPNQGQLTTFSHNGRYYSSNLGLRIMKSLDAPLEFPEFIGSYTYTPNAFRSWRMKSVYNFQPNPVRGRNQKLYLSAKDLGMILDFWAHNGYEGRLLPLHSQLTNSLETTPRDSAFRLLISLVSEDTSPNYVFITLLKGIPPENKLRCLADYVEQNASSSNLLGAYKDQVSKLVQNVYK